MSYIKITKPTKFKHTVHMEVVPFKPGMEDGTKNFRHVLGTDYQGFHIDNVEIQEGDGVIIHQNGERRVLKQCCLHDDGYWEPIE